MRAVHKNVPVLFEPYEWLVKETEYSKERNRNNETIFTIGNGWLGVRGFFEEGLYFDDIQQTETAALINGIYEFYDFNHIWRRPGFPARYHSISNQANPFEFAVFHNGEKVNLGGKVSDYLRVLDMRDGTVNRRFRYTFADGTSVCLEFERFASQICKNVLHMRVRIVADKDMELELSCNLNGLPKDRCSNSCSVYTCELVKNWGDSSFVEYSTKRSGFTIRSGQRHTLSGADYSVEECVCGANVNRRYRVVAKKDVPVVYERTIAYATTFDIKKEELARAVEGYLDENAPRGYEANKSLSKAEWSKFWSLSDIRIGGDVLVQQGVRFALFMLNQSCGRDGKTNISANGLTGSGYDGWTFWDTEIFMLPMFLYSQPQIARKLLEYRYSILPMAKRRAVEVDGEGTRGALYAWQSTNGEECAHLYECAPGQIHIDPDISLTIQRYFEATQDFEFIENYGAEMLFEMSIYMAHRGAFIPLKGNKFCYNVVCGPDEYSPAVDNNTYTNWLARKQFQFTLQIYDMLKDRCPAKLQQIVQKCGLTDEDLDLFRRIAENMYIGYNEDLGIYTQDDEFLYRDPIDLDSIPKEKLPLLFSMHPLNLWRYQVCKQADIVLLIYLCADEFSSDMKRKIFDYYEPKTIHDSSLSAGIHSIVACDIGYRDEAYGYLKQSARMDLDNVNRNTYFGVHSANMGNTYQILVNGFAGMRTSGGKLHFRPFLPSHWTELSFCVRFQGSTIRVNIDQQGTKFELLNGDSIVVSLNGKDYEVR